MPNPTGKAGKDFSDKQKQAQYKPLLEIAFSRKPIQTKLPVVLDEKLRQQGNVSALVRQWVIEGMCRDGLIETPEEHQVVTFLMPELG